MPHVVVGGRVCFWHDRDRRHATLRVESAVQSLSCARISDLIAGHVVHELDILCCSVTIVDSHGRPTWFAAVSPSRHVCCDEDTILVPLGDSSVRTVVMCALHLQSHARRHARWRSTAVRSLLSAQRAAKNSVLLRPDQLAFDVPREIFCRETCTALVAALVPSPRTRTPTEATLPNRRFCMDDLPGDLQVLIAVHCASSGHLRLPDLALVSKTFNRYATMARNCLALRLEHEIARCNAKEALRAGAEIACRGMWPLRTQRCAWAARDRRRHDFSNSQLHSRSRPCAR